MKRLKRVAVVLLFLISTLNATDIGNSELITSYAKKFLNTLKNKQGINEFLAEGIKINFINKTDLIKMTDSFMNEKINVIDYVKKISGNNLYKVLNGYNEKGISIELNIKSFSIIGNVGRETKISSEGKLYVHFYYLKVNLGITKKYFKEGQSHPYKVSEIEVESEINVMPLSNNKFKIFGFIM